ncbi:hypothetical protein LX97_02846 [Nonlabens dokdonensis]|uniref:Uncharacterized protein n=1 Tax=Nonlabens dokdonensis TaxID=328515 RepID=A0ABX5PVV5_9FLAO|nr:hypothetical protein [Nonlabens dokdonensis]PZX38265.1 hypothetical protein LX97_02846 [Nonlabens dokdonensis]
MFELKYFSAKAIVFFGSIAFIITVLNSVLMVIYLIEQNVVIPNLERNLEMGTFLTPISLLHLWSPKILEKTVSVDFFKNNSFDQQKESISKQVNKKQTCSKVIIGICYIILLLAWLKFLT